MKDVIKMIKGSLVGIGSILPGISGSMIAAILKIYQELIDALNDFLKHPILSIKSVWQYIVGVIIGFMIGFAVINLIYEKIPILLTLLFIGFILGAIPSLFREIKINKIKINHIITFILPMLMMIGFLFLKESSAEVSSFYYYVSIFLIGIIYAVALIIPGLSGSTMLIAFGYFQILVSTVDDIFKSFIQLDFYLILTQLPLLLLLILGAVIGLLVVGKLMHYLLHHYKNYFYIAVLGIVFASPINIIVTLEKESSVSIFKSSIWIYLIGLILCFIGALTTYKLSNKGEKI